MTLCVAWIRQVEDTEELVFATDSCLTGAGEKWDNGVKLFELPNRDGLICFTGTTSRAYPLILNLISSINHDEQFKKNFASVVDLKDHILDLFSDLIKSITDFVEDKHTIRGEARFLFGGWDWKASQFRIWYVLYNSDKECFEASELTDDSQKTNFYVFIGEAKDIDIEEEAQTRFTNLLIKENKLHNKLNMEPLKILREVSLDSDIQGVSGSLQIAKVHKSNQSEFFGIFWPSSKGKPHFQGRKYKLTEKPSVQYFDPDTFEILELDIPSKLNSIEQDAFGEDLEFVKSCYPKGILKEGITDREKHKLKVIIKELTYADFLAKETLDNNENSEEG
ncbi:hypothetical protein [Echinicola salinicaeni]|uniref:hypothetical protein n=1 Tax=Echinicola salinicaeni TaxID=2762757 RepID=UPI001644A001|nr:hypothetical protein [Echinicola salinicaeni]